MPFPVKNMVKKCCSKVNITDMAFKERGKPMVNLKGDTYYTIRCECDLPLQAVWKSASSDISSVGVSTLMCAG